MAATRPTPDIAEGVHLCGSEHVNWYIVEEGDAITLVDTGFPTHWEQLLQQLAALDFDVSDVEACLLTHAHPDHIGFAEQLHEQADVPIWLHEEGIQRARNGGDPPLGGFVRNIWRPAIIRYFTEVIKSGGTSVPPVTTVEPFTDRDELDVPGHPEVFHVPGHTEDELVFYLPDRDILFCGDALATVDFETWRGNTPQLMPSWLNADHARARESLRRLEPLGEVVPLPGHGDPWSGDLPAAIRAE